MNMDEFMEEFVTFLESLPGIIEVSDEQCVTLFIAYLEHSDPVKREDMSKWI